MDRRTNVAKRSCLSIRYGRLHAAISDGRHSRFVIDPTQLIELEGNFSKDFHVFVPRKHEAIALSILTPDVMVTLQKYATAFDVEIYGDQVRIISNKRVTHNRELQDALLVVALKVMAEIDHRLTSWSRPGSLAARDQDLLIHPGAGIRISGRYITYWAIDWTLYWLFVCAGLSVAAIAVLIDPKQPCELGIFLLSLFVILFALTVIVTIRRWRSDSFHSRRGWRHKEHRK